MDAEDLKSDCHVCAVQWLERDALHNLRLLGTFPPLVDMFRYVSEVWFGWRKCVTGDRLVE